MTPEAIRSCREVLERFRAQIDQHLPKIEFSSSPYGGGAYAPQSQVPLDRLPMIGQLVQQYIEAEAVFAQASTPPADAE